MDPRELRDRRAVISISTATIESLVRLPSDVAVVGSPYVDWWRSSVEFVIVAENIPKVAEGVRAPDVQLWIQDGKLVPLIPGRCTWIEVPSGPKVMCQREEDEAMSAWLTEHGYYDPFKAGMVDECSVAWDVGMITDGPYVTEVTLQWMRGLDLWRVHYSLPPERRCIGVGCEHHP